MSQGGLFHRLVESPVISMLMKCLVYFSAFCCNVGQYTADIHTSSAILRGFEDQQNISVDAASESGKTEMGSMVLPTLSESYTYARR